jgi:GNAT superfamily N-acetyltransferase
MDIRYAVGTDAEDIARLISLTSKKYNFSENEPCPTWFVASIDQEKIKELIQTPHYVWHIAVQENKVIGVLAVSENKLIKYFFVHPDYHRKGIAISIWQRALPFLASEVTVRSSAFAIPFYERLGFKKVGGIDYFNGVSYQSMIANF